MGGEARRYACARRPASSTGLHTTAANGRSSVGLCTSARVDTHPPSCVLSAALSAVQAAQQRRQHAEGVVGVRDERVRCSVLRAWHMAAQDLRRYKSVITYLRCVFVWTHLTCLVSSHPPLAVD